MSQKIQYLKPNYYYHIYNRGNDKNKIFYTEENYLYFKKKYEQYVSPIAETYAYCLMPNHFHFLVKIKSEEELFEFLRNSNKLLENIELSEFKISDVDILNSILIKQFSNFFNGYAQAINKQESKTGSLFQKPFRKKEIDSDDYLKRAILYIHNNPVNHGFVDKISEWPYSSYNAILRQSDNLIKSKEVIDLFEDINNFRETHKFNNLVKLEEDF